MAPLVKEHTSGATYQMIKEPNTNTSKVPNKRRTQWWQPLANVVTSHCFTLLLVFLTLLPTQHRIFYYHFTLYDHCTVATPNCISD